MTQHQLILLYVQEFGEIIPAKMSGKSYLGGFFGSETPRRCRELRQMGKLVSDGVGRFERFYLPDRLPVKEGEVISIWEQQKKLEELRRQYVQEKDPKKREVIAARGKLLKIALEMAKDDEHVKNIVETMYD